MNGKELLVGLVAGMAWCAGAAVMIDTAHDRVQTTFDPQMDRIGTLRPRPAREVGRSHLAIGCEMLPRGYGDFEAFKEYLPPLGIAHVRLHAGWAKLEPEPVLVDLVTGAVYRLPGRMAIGSFGKDRIYEDLPFYDAPVVLTERKLALAGAR